MDYRRILSGQRDDPLAVCLRWTARGLSLPYAGAVRLRNLAYDRHWLKIHPLPLPVISVGNLTVGGTGKTPCVAWLARFYRDQGLRVAIVSRGYGAEVGAVNDEARELEALLPDVPHVQDADRFAAAQIAMEELAAQVIVLDDGFQHRRLARTLDLVLVDATCPWGYSWCLPGGLLREPLGGLRRAQAVLLTRCDHASPDALESIRQKVKQLSPSAILAESTHRPQQWRSSDDQTRPLDELRGRRVLAVAAIGHPEPFFASLERLDMQLADKLIWPDHHHFQRDDVQRIAARAQQTDVDAIVCTHKDLVKLAVPRLGGRPVWALQIGLEIYSGREPLCERLTEAVRDAPRDG